jgi:cleavage and polyadenylation specificity factor subunit 2
MAAESSISFEALSGAKDESPFAYLLHIDGFNILLDCGWTDDFDDRQISTLMKYASSIDAVLISHCTVQHIGALPYLCQHHGLSAPVYATSPVKSLGSLLLFDCYLNKRDEDEFHLFNASDIRRTFDAITSMSYQEELTIGDNIIITPYKAGRTIGSAIWRITKGENEVIYTNSIWQGSDRLLDGYQTSAQWHPTLWILDARGGADDKTIRADEYLSFFQTIRKRVDQGHVVLLPVDGVSRALEILLQLHEFWESQGLLQNIYFLSHTSQQIIETVNQMSEWLHQELTQKVLQTTQSCFDLPRVTCITDMNDLPPGGYVVLATSDTLEHGFSRRIFLANGSRPSQLVCFTTKQPKGSLAEMLTTDNTHRDIPLVEKLREPLIGEELLAYRQQQEMARLREATVDRFSDSDETDEENQPEADLGKVVTAQPLKSRFQFAIPKRPPMTDYGVHIEHADYAKGVQHAALVDEKTAQAIAQPLVGRSIVEDPEEVPSKYCRTEQLFQFKATSMYFDFEARTKFFRLKALLQRYSPAHVIIIGANHEATMTLHDVLKDNMKAFISTPSIGENVFLTFDQSTLKIGLSRALYNRLDFKKIDDFSEVAYLDAVLAPDDVIGRSAKPVDEVVPHHASFIGKIDMPALMGRLTDQGLKVVFQNGLIVGRRKIEVRQTGDNTISVEGVMCADFIKLRNIIQEMFAMV